MLVGAAEKLDPPNDEETAQLTEMRRSAVSGISHRDRASPGGAGGHSI